MLALVWVLGTPAAAGVGDTKVEAQAAAVPYEVHADLHDEYLAGEPMVVALSVHNSTTESLAFPDLANRPWLVEFELVGSDGRKQVRKNTAPESDTAQVWNLSPRGERQVLLEVPGAGALAPGSYDLTVRIPANDVALDTRQIVLATPQPVAADLGIDAQAARRFGVPSLWLHKASGGYDLYLHQADGGDPSKSASNAWLLRLTDKIQPYLSAARAQDHADRHVYWLESDRGLRYARLQDRGLRGTPRLVEAPWPKIELVGRGATDGVGVLHVPLWVPAPKGSAGQLVVLSLDGRNAPLFRKVARMDVRPLELRSSVDSAGTVHFLVRDGPHVDDYKVAGRGAEGMPVAGKALWSADRGQEVLDARFGFLEAGEGYPGGLGVHVLSQKGSEVWSTWVGLGGEVVVEQAQPWTIATGASLVDVCLSGDTSPGVALRGVDGTTTWYEGNQAGVLPAALGASWSPIRDAKGAPYLRSTSAGGPVKVTPVALVVAKAP